MWATLAISLIYVCFINMTVNAHIGPIHQDKGEGIIVGQIYKTEVKNDRINVYLKNIKIESNDINVQNIVKLKQSTIVYRNTGAICSFEEGEKGQYKCGQKIKVKGEIRLYDVATNPGQFDARKYYLSKNVLARVDKCEVQEIYGHENIMVSGLQAFRYLCEDKLNEALNDKDAGLMNAILFADKSGIDTELKDIYSTAGAGHLLAISGLHISMLGLGILWLLKRTPLPLPMAYVGTILILIIYGIMIGFTPSAMRAIIMFAIMCVAQMWRKSYDTLTGLAIALFVTTLFNPFSSLQAGFYMTYLAIIGLAIVAPSLSPFKKKMNKLLSGLVASISVNITTMPIVMNSYYQLPIWGVLLNVILVPGMTVIIGLGICTIVWQILIPIRINVFAGILHLILLLYELSLRAVLALPGAVYLTGHRSLIRVVVYLIILIILCIITKQIRKTMWVRGKILNNYRRHNPSKNCSQIHRKEKINKSRYIFGMYLLILINMLILLININSNRIDFLDVGQGLCGVVQYNGQVYMFDCGSTSKNNLYKNIVSPYLKYYGIRKVDALFVSHEDADHTSGIKDMLADKKMKVRNMYCSSALKEEVSSALDIVDVSELDNADVAKIDSMDVAKIDSMVVGTFKNVGVTALDNLHIIPLEAGDRLQGNGIEWIVLSPEEEDINDSNGNSLVVLMKVQEGNALFMADAGEMAERRVEEYLNGGQIDIYQVAHHGSANGTNTEDFIENIRPKMAVISCGYKNSYNHPHKETIERLTQTSSAVMILRTDESGRVSIKID